MQLVVGGRLVHYLEFNPNGKTVVVVLHGWGHEALMWSGVAKLMPAEWRIVIPDLPGFGQSQSLTGEANIPEYAQWTTDFLQSLKVTEPIMIAHSVGGQIATFGVAKEIIKVGKLILIAPSLKRFEEKVIPLSIKIWQLLAKFKSLLPKKIVTQISTGTDYGVASSPQREILKRIIRFDVSQFLPLIPSPTLGIWGEKDRETLGVPKKLISQIPNGRLRIIYNAGHNLYLERPDELVRILEHFLWQ